MIAAGASPPQLAARVVWQCEELWVRPTRCLRNFRGQIFASLTGARECWEPYCWQRRACADSMECRRDRLYLLRPRSLTSEQVQAEPVLWGPLSVWRRWTCERGDSAAWRWGHLLQERVS